ncbi:unnamed protein product [Ectocarpus sp. 13 AM-2016]
MLDNTAEEDPLLSIGGKSREDTASSASTSSMTNLDSDDHSHHHEQQQQQQQQRREMEVSLENDDDEDDLHGKHMNRTRIPCFWSRTGVWVSHARLLSLVMVLDLMILSVQVCVICKVHQRAVFEPRDEFLLLPLLLCAPIPRDEKRYVQHSSCRGNKGRTGRTESNRCAVISSELCVRISAYICICCCCPRPPVRQVSLLQVLFERRCECKVCSYATAIGS